MAETARQATMWAEMKPDLYGGKTCDKEVPRWEVYADGDKDSDTTRSIALAARCFPPGTRITIEEPCCPQCGETRAPIYPYPKRGPLYAGKCQCGFDWDDWVAQQYS